MKTIDLNNLWIATELTGPNFGCFDNKVGAIEFAKQRPELNIFVGRLTDIVIYRKK